MWRLAGRSIVKHFMPIFGIPRVSLSQTDPIGFARSMVSVSRFPISESMNRPSTLCQYTQTRTVTNKLRKRWKIRKYHFKLRLKRTMRKMRVPYLSSKPRGQVKKKPILYDFRPALRRKLKRAER